MTRAISLLLALVVLSACAAPERDDDGLALLASLGVAEGLMRQADSLEATGDVAGAIERAEQILTIDFPAGPDREDVRLDAHGRIAELELARGDAAAARARAQAGLEEASRDSYFHARLLLVLGRVQEAEATRARDAGDTEAARRMSLDAVATLEQSIAMNQRVLTGLDAAGRP